jgi:hypothetical protein
MGPRRGHVCLDGWLRLCGPRSTIILIIVVILIILIILIVSIIIIIIIIVVVIIIIHGHHTTDHGTKAGTTHPTSDPYTSALHAHTYTGLGAKTAGRPRPAGTCCEPAAISTTSATIL